MSYGLRVNNDAGNLVIDATYQNMHLQSKSVFGLSAGGEHTVSTPYTEGVLFLSVVGGFAGIIEQGAAGNSWVIRAASVCTVSAYIFTPGTPKREAWGMEVYSDTGVLVFSSAASALRVRDLNLLPFRNDTETFASFQKGYGVAVAACVSIPRTKLISGSSKVRTDAINTDGGVLTVAHNLEKSYAPFREGWGTHTGLVFGNGSVPVLTAVVTGI